MPPAALEARARRNVHRGRPPGRGRRGRARAGRRRAAAPPHAAADPGRVRVRHPAAARGRVRRRRQGRPGRPARPPGPLGGRRSSRCPAPSLGLDAWTRVDAFIADQAERAASLADAVSLRPEAPARAVAPLGVAALGRLARRAIRAGEPAQAAQFGQRAAALAGGELPPPDRLVHGQRAAAARPGRRGAGRRREDRRRRPRRRRRRAGSRALLLAGPGPPAARRRRSRRPGAGSEALRVATAADLPAERAEALRRIGMEDYLRGRLREAQPASARRSPSPRRPATGAARRGRCRTWPGSRPPLGDFAGADATLGPGRPALRRAAATPPAGPGCAAPPRSPGCSPGGCTRPAGWPSAFLPFGERVGERWAVGTLRAVDAFAAAELGDLAEADREARRAYRDFDAIDDDWGRGLRAGGAGRGGPRPGRAGARHRPAHRRLPATASATGHPLLLGMAHTIRGFASLELRRPGRGRGRRPRGAGRGQAARRGRRGPGRSAGAARLRPAGHGRRRRGAGGAGRGGRDRRRRRRCCSPAGRRWPRTRSALLAAGRVDEALAAARRAAELPAEDVRGRVVADRVLARALAAAGECDEARAAAGGGPDGVRDPADQRAGRRRRDPGAGQSDSDADGPRPVAARGLAHSHRWLGRMTVQPGERADGMARAVDPAGVTCSRESRTVGAVRSACRPSRADRAERAGARRVRDGVPGHPDVGLPRGRGQGGEPDPGERQGPAAVRPRGAGGRPDVEPSARGRPLRRRRHRRRPPIHDHGAVRRHVRRPDEDQPARRRPRRATSAPRSPTRWPTRTRSACCTAT